MTPRHQLRTGRHVNFLVSCFVLSFVVKFCCLIVLPFTFGLLWFVLFLFLLYSVACDYNYYAQASAMVGTTLTLLSDSLSELYALQITAGTVTIVFHVCLFVCFCLLVVVDVLLLLLLFA